VPTKVIFDAHGALPEEAALNAQARGLSSAKTATSVELARALERHAWREADGVVAVSRALLDHLARAYGPRTGPMARVPCATSLAAMPPLESRMQIRASLGLADRDVVVYVGSLAPYQEPREMIRLFS